MSRIFAATSSAIAAFISAPVLAQEMAWSGYVPRPASNASPLPLTGNEYIVANCNFQAPGNYRCSENQLDVRTYFVPISAFAQAQTVAQLRDDLGRTNENINRSAALSSVLDHQVPLDGSSNRLGFSTSDFDGRAAIGINYSRRLRQVDFGLSVGAAGRSHAGKLSAGVSW